jgi:transcriptional regulator with XRE-family HTH domain
MQFLYVCRFSNGHIKVGCSNDPATRIRQHADRVACLGVSLTERFDILCADGDESREQALIDRCVEHATMRFQLEWFAGLDFSGVCAWAREAAIAKIEPRDEDTFGFRLRCARLAAGLSQAQLGVGLAPDGGDLQKATISAWEVGRNSPTVHDLRRICKRLLVSADVLVFGADQPPTQMNWSVLRESPADLLRKNRKVA